MRTRCTRRAFLSLVPSARSASPRGPRARDSKPDKDKPSIEVKSLPSMGFAPFRTVLTVDVKGGPDDYRAVSTARSVEWDIGDGDSGRAEDWTAIPYEAGKSQIKRRYVREQIFNSPGEFHVHVPSEAEEQGRRHRPDDGPRPSRDTRRRGMDR